ncbi:MAG: helix-turn-helix domain-containing protein [Candidatus Dormibacteria bacterium]|jgi:AcrR family transcriptional regulator
MSPRRTDTRRRALEVALELFTEQGYEKTSLREIADRLGIRQASLYYHFPSKDALLAGIMEDLLAPVDELVAWSQAQPRTAATRQELLRRMAVAIGGPFSRWIQFAQANQTTLRDHRAEGLQMQRRLMGLFAAVIDPDAEPRQQVRSLLALAAVYLGNLTPVVAMLSTFGIRSTIDEFGAAAMEVAQELVEDG